MDRFSKLAKKVQTSKTTATAVAEVFVAHWISDYRIPCMVFTYNDLQATLMFFNVVCAELGIETLATSEYHPDSNGKVKPFNLTLISRLNHYVAEDQKE